MILLIFLLLCLVTPTAHALGARRLSPHQCEAKAYILAQGAPVHSSQGSRTFTDQEGFVNPRVDSTGHGTALLNKMPPCLQENAMSIKVDGPAALVRAIAWLDIQCAEERCVVYSDYEPTRGRFEVYY